MKTNAKLAFITSISAMCVLSTSLLAAAENAIVPEVNPPGDIPDSQVFVKYEGTEGFSIKYPEGWSRVDKPNEHKFSDKYDAITVRISDFPGKLDLPTVKTSLVPEIEKSGRAVSISKIDDAKFKSSTAFRAEYDSNSDPNSVTNKQVRNENVRYFFWRNGKLATLDMSAPKGADNIDQWNLISHSFTWK